MDDSSGDEEDDPVVHEIDMCLAKTLAERLFLFQYPVRPSSFSYDHTRHLAARMKPKQQKVELELAMDIGASTYCFPRGEQIARAVDHYAEGTSQKTMFHGSVMDRHILSSTRATQDSSKYAAAVYSDGALHITPVKGIIQLRPGFNYFDKAEENQKKAAANLKAENGDSQDEEDPELKPVQMRFSKVPMLGKAKQKVVDDNANEEWIEFQFHQPHDHRSKMERKLLHCHQDDFEAPEFNVTSRDYLKLLLPPAEQDYSSPAAMPHGVLSLLKLKTMDFPDQVKALLITAKALQFTQLCVLLGGGLDEKVVLKALEQYALLVQGCWVVKSDVLHPKGTTSHISGIDAEKIWPTRDYVMFCFNRKRLLSRKEVSSVSRLPTEELREVLEQMARQRPAQGWEFTLSTDNDFLQRHPEVSISQLSVWKKKYKSMMEQLHITEDFFKADFKENDFAGIFPQLQRKPITPRRRNTSISVDSQDKNKIKAKRQRSRSQTSDTELAPLKEEPESPRSMKGNETKTVNPSVLHKPPLSNKPEKTAIRNITENIKYEENLTNNTKEIKIEPGTSKSSNKSKRKKILTIDSDNDDSEEEKGQFSGTISKDEEFRQVIEKPGNEIEVDINISLDDEHGQTSNNSDDIFIPPVAVSGKNKSVVKLEKEKPPSEIFIKELKKFARNSIRSSCVSLGELKEILNTRQKEPGNILCTGVDDDVLLKCVLDTGAIEVSIVWGDNCQVPHDRQRVFLYRELNEANDKFRTTVVDMFFGRLSLKKKEIMEKLSKVVGEVPSYHMYSKFLSEFCENHGGQWYLHGTYQSLQKYQLPKP